MNRDAQASVAISKKGNGHDTINSLTADDRAFGSHAAEILRECAREVALASSTEAKLAAFLRGAATLGKAVSGLWLPKNVVVDRQTVRGQKVTCVTFNATVVALNVTS
jgi:hypothetical protein